MFKEKNIGQTGYCTHENNNESGVCAKCLGKTVVSDYPISVTAGVAMGYPINTFTGETRKELLAWRDSTFDLLLEKIGTAKRMWTSDEIRQLIRETAIELLESSEGSEGSEGSEALDKSRI